jgi:hypothetical protein
VNWLEIAAIVVLLIGIGAGGFLVAQRPSFWIGLVTAVARPVLPLLVALVAKRMPPEKEQEWRDCIRRGGEWDHHRKRCKR